MAPILCSPSSSRPTLRPRGKLSIPGARQSLIKFLLIGAWSITGIQAAETEPSELKLAELELAIESIETWLTGAQQQRPVLEQRLQQAESRLAEIASLIATTRQELATGQERLTDLERRQIELNDQRIEQLALLKQLLRAAYKAGPQGTLKLVLNQEDPARTARLLHYYRRLNANRLARVAEFEQTLTSLDDTRQALEATRSKLLNDQEQLNARLQQLESVTAVRQQTLAELDAAIQDRTLERDGLVADREALQALVNEVQRVMDGVAVPDSSLPFPQRQGELPWPGSGTLVSAFGDRYGNGDLQRQGITISSPAGDPVRAVHAGRVVFADWMRGVGLLVILDHGDGYMSLYGHNAELIRDQGSWVNAGEVIATAGNSGGQSETGIYFEVRHNGRPQNPAEWLQPRDQ